MKTLFFSILIVVFVTVSFAAVAEETKSSSGKVQRVDFGDTDINGKVRSPDGTYMVQKRGMEFAPMYKVKKKLNDGVKESLEYIH